jgi:hypothetical protein
MKHPSHQTRISMDASTYDEICINCGATDEVPGGWGRLAAPCPAVPPAGECTCRNRLCGHPASAHSGPEGACVVDGCRCGPGGWT